MTPRRRRRRTLLLLLGLQHSPYHSMYITTLFSRGGRIAVSTDPPERAAGRMLFASRTYLDLDATEHMGRPGLDSGYRGETGYGKWDRQANTAVDTGKRLPPSSCLRRVQGAPCMSCFTFSPHGGAPSNMHPAPACPTGAAGGCKGGRSTQLACLPRAGRMTERRSPRNQRGPRGGTAGNQSGAPTPVPRPARASHGAPCAGRTAPRRIVWGR